MVRDPAEGRGKRLLELALDVELHEVLPEVVDTRDDALGFRPRKQARVFLLQHPAAGGTGHDDVAARVDSTPESLEVAPRPARRAGDVAAVERRHAAADLLGTADLDTAPPEHAHRGDADVGTGELDRRRVEEGHAPGAPDTCGRRLAAEPAAEAPGVAWQATPAVDPERLLHRPAHGAILVHPVRDRRDRRADAAEQLGIPEHPVAERDAFTVGAGNARLLHEQRKIDGPAVRRGVGAERIAELAAEAEIDRSTILLDGERGDVSVVLVDRVEQMGERRTEVVAAAAPGADVVDAGGFGRQVRRIAEWRRPDVRRARHLTRDSGFADPS